MTEIGAEIMFESEIEQLKKHLAAKLPQPQPFVYLHDILASVIDDCYKHSIQADVDWWIYEEQLERADHPHFDTTAPELQEMFAALDDAYRQYARFSNSQFNEAIDSAVKVRLNFLCRPRTTLKWFIFRGAPTKTVYEIALRLSYFSDYNYLTTGFHEWAQKTYSMHPSMDLLSVVEFEKIMETIDNDFILDLSPHQFVDMLIPLFEFFHLGKEFTPQLTIPTEALIVFLDDKGIELIAHEIERLLYNEDMEQISQERFLDIVTDIINQIEEMESHTSPVENTAETATIDEEATEEHTTPVNTEEESEVHLSEEVSETQNEPDLEITETVEEMMIETSKILEEIAPEIPDIAEDIINEDIKIHDEMTSESFKSELSENNDTVGAQRPVEDTVLEQDSVKPINESADISTESIENYETEHFETENYKTENYETEDYETENYETEDYETESYETEDYKTENYTSIQVEAIQEEEPAKVLANEENTIQSIEEQNVDFATPNAIQETGIQEVTLEDENLHEIRDESQAVTSFVNDEVQKATLDAEEEILPENIEIQGETPVKIEEYQDELPIEIFDVAENHQPQLHTESAGLQEQPTPESAEVLEEMPDLPPVIEVDTNNEYIIFHDGFSNRPILPEQDVVELPVIDVEELPIIAISDISEIPKQIVPSLLSYIDSKQREEFIKKLCGKDEQMFIQLIDDIDKCAAWREAAQVIDRFFIRHKIDHRSAPAISFRTIVQKRYSGI